MTHRSTTPETTLDTSETDMELLTRWRGGDKVAAGVLVDRYFEPVQRFFRSKVAGEIEDLVQQTFLGCLEAQIRLLGETSFRAYLFGVARYQLYHYYSRKRRGAALDFTISSVCDLATSPTGLLARREEEQLLLTALQRIPVDYQIVLELIYWEELPAVEVAIVLGVPENTLYSRLRRARLQLRAVMKELGAPEQAWPFDRSDDE